MINSDVVLYDFRFVLHECFRNDDWKILSSNTLVSTNKTKFCIDFKYPLYERDEMNNWSQFASETN